MPRPHRVSFAVLATLLLLSLGAADEKSPGGKGDKLAADKAALAPLQAWVGEWKGTGQPRRGSTVGSWTEKGACEWKFTADHAQLAWKLDGGKYFSSAVLTPGDKAGRFTLTGTAADGKTAEQFAGSLADGVLTLESDKPAAGRPARITVRTVAGGDRLTVLYEAKTASGYARLAEVGSTREGSGFAKGTGEIECIVTGGKGTIAVTHKGETYYVCCSGCRDLFKEDPEGVLKEYREKLAAKKTK